MKPATAQTVRRLGLALEAVCLLGLLWLPRQNIAPRGFLGLDPRQVLMTGLAVGFTLWLVGTASFYWAKRGPGERS